MKHFLWSLAVVLTLTAWSVPAHAAEGFRVGTWKTAQTIALFFYQNYLPGGAEILSFKIGRASCRERV